MSVHTPSPIYIDNYSNVHVIYNTNITTVRPSPVIPNNKTITTHSALPSPHLDPLDSGLHFILVAQIAALQRSDGIRVWDDFQVVV